LGLFYEIRSLGSYAPYTFFSFSEEKNHYTLSEEEVSLIESQHQYLNTKKLLNDLENYESYRPDSFNDTTCNPFKKNVINWI
jgi:hypothetical protein